MLHTFLVYSVVGLITLCAGCTTQQSVVPLYPDDPGAQAVRTSSQFDTITNNSNEYVGQKIKLAGRIEYLISSKEGYEVLAKWLPYPEIQPLDQGPRDPEVDPRRYFLIHFEGKRERPFVTTHGNVFILQGTVEGTRKALVNTLGHRQNLLSVNTQCVHVWETGDDTISDSPDSQYPDARSKTFCADQ